MGCVGFSIPHSLTHRFLATFATGMTLVVLVAFKIVEEKCLSRLFNRDHNAPVAKMKEDDPNLIVMSHSNGPMLGPRFSCEVEAKSYQSLEKLMDAIKRYG